MYMYNTLYVFLTICMEIVQAIAYNESRHKNMFIPS